MRPRKFSEFGVMAYKLMSNSFIFKKTIKWRLPISDEKLQIRIGSHFSENLNQSTRVLFWKLLIMMLG